MRLIIVTSIVLALAGLPARAAVPIPVMKIHGAQFYNQCTNPPPGDGQQIVGICAAYVAGIADGLMDAGQVCLDPHVTAPGLLPFALRWIKNHMQNGGYPAALQIKTGLVAMYPCNRAAPARVQQSSIEEKVELGIKFFNFLKAAQTALTAMGM